MPYPISSLEETRAFLMALGRALFPESNYGSVGSWHGRRATFLGAAVTEIHAHVDAVQRDAHPLTAGDGKPINDWGEAVGVERKSATPARKSIAARVSGAAGAIAVIDLQLRHETSGLLFKLAQTVTIPGIVDVGPDGHVDADIVGVDVGAQTRLDAGQVLMFVETPPGIETSVVLQLDLDEDGYDDEQFGSYRNRVLSTFSQTPSGGSQSDFVKWALASLPSVATAFAYPNRAGRGTIDVVAFYRGSGTSRSLTAPDRAAVAAYIRTKAPFQIAGEGGGLRVLTTIADPQDIEVTLSPSSEIAFQFDWDDSGPPTVAAWNGTTRRLQFSADLPISLRAGHRLILVGDGREWKIESIVTTATDAVILEKVPVPAPTAGDLIYSGGPLVTPVRDAIVAHLDGQIVYAGRGRTPLPASAVQSSVGLDVLAEGIGSANPGGRFGPWTGGILRATLYTIGMYKAGVRNISVITPATDYEAVSDEFPADDQIHYVTPGVVIVRRG